MHPTGLVTFEDQNITAFLFIFRGSLSLKRPFSEGDPKLQSQDHGCSVLGFSHKITDFFPPSQSEMLQ